ncbi:glycoside hydrolase [Massariosphaeria phaeospora]|uniref:lytic cellulose monooxygenase (C4-dehydrogenating) n=1 Tax=Massariosphaeria phaeospora TaxID=100035 RepID=A0A7C8I113_9PLEO|nr:glycoside hydrolase [Massariosphaeria phaeospora]
MKYSLISLLLAQSTAAHYVFSHLLVNGTETKEWEYTREIGYGWEGKPYRDSPAFSVDTQDIICGYTAWNTDNSLSGIKPNTADVVAGSEIGFRISKTYGILLPPTNETFLYHEGPAQAYLSRSDNLQAYRGDGDWFKIAALLAKDDTTWQVGGLTVKDANFTIPRATPPGTYLLRFEQFRPGYDVNQTQWFVACAHINVIGSGSSTAPTHFAKFPGTYKPEDEGITISPDFYPQGKKSLLQYKPPGPPVFGA